MFRREDHLIIIPARRGSTRIRHKNLKSLGGAPLISYAIAAAKESCCGTVLVSTNCADIAKVARDYGAWTPFVRPEELSHATASSLGVILHALTWLWEKKQWRPEIVTQCPPTNPFIQASTIAAMYRQLRDNTSMNSIVTITHPKTHPFRIVGKSQNGSLLPGLISLEGKRIQDVDRSQDWPTVWEGSPACRMTRARYFWNLLEEDPCCANHRGVVYDADACCGYEIDAQQALDIDDEASWRYAETYMALHQKKDTMTQDHAFAS